MKSDNTLLIGLGCVAAYFLFIKPKTTVPGTIVPGTGQSYPYGYNPNTSNPITSIITTTGNTLSSIIDALSGGNSSTPNQNDQIPVTNTPGTGSNAAYPGQTQLPDYIPSVLPTDTSTLVDNTIPTDSQDMSYQ